MWNGVNWLYAQLHYFLNLSQLIVSCLPLLDKPINPGVSDLSSHNNNNQAHLHFVEMYLSGNMRYLKLVQEKKKTVQCSENFTVLQ